MNVPGRELSGHLHTRSIQALMLAAIGGFVAGLFNTGGWASVLTGIVIAAVFGIAAVARMPDAELVAIRWREEQRLREARDQGGDSA